MTASLAAVVLCAGKGTRMNSERAKVLHPILGKPLAWYPLQRAFDVGAQTVVAVVGHQGDAVKAELSGHFTAQPLTFATQEQQLGTGHAVRCARGALQGFSGAVLIVMGDVPLITKETLSKLVSAFTASRGPLAMVTMSLADPTGYGRIVRGAGGKVTGIVEHKDASDEQRKITELNAGIYVADARFLWSALETLTPQNAQGELYLTDIVAKAAAIGDVATINVSAIEAAGVNDKVELADRAAVMRQRINRGHQLAGVTLEDPATTFIDEGVELGKDTTLGPNVSLRGTCVVGSGVSIDQGSVLTNSTVGDGTHVKPYSILEEAVVGPKCHIGPFARLRPETVLDEGVHIGNFVETKKARLKKGSKANHLSYLGDADIGANCNIGAGTITCNYDGYNKHKTTLGDGVFIGSDTQLVAPVKVGDGAFVAAGTTLTDSVPANAMAISRTPQTMKEGWAERYHRVMKNQKSR